MAKVGGQTIASEITALYTRLNAVRKNHSLATINRTFKANTPTLSSQMSTLKTDLDSTAKDSKWITTKTYNLGEIGIGKPNKLATYTAANTAITDFEKVCAHNSNRSDDSDDWDNSYDGDFGNMGDNSNDHDNSNDGKCSYDGIG